MGLTNMVIITLDFNNMPDLPLVPESSNRPPSGPVGQFASPRLSNATSSDVEGRRRNLWSTTSKKHRCRTLPISTNISRSLPLEVLAAAHSRWNERELPGRENPQEIANPHRKGLRRRT